MIDWETINPVLVDLIETLSGLQVVWADKRRPMVDPRNQALVLLRIRGSQDIGVDDRRYRDTGAAIPAYPFRESAAGHRRVSIEIRVESFRHDDDRHAFNATEAIRTRLRWASSAERLRAVELAVIEKGETVDVSNLIQDDRVTSAALFELMLAAGVSAEDTTPIAAIETVEDPLGIFS